MTSPAPTLLDNEPTFGTNADGLFIRYTQAIPDEFLDSLKSERHAKSHLRAAEMNRVASVPTHLVELWIAQGRDFWNASPREIVSWLRKDNLDAFITTPGSV